MASRRIRFRPFLTGVQLMTHCSNRGNQQWRPGSQLPSRLATMPKESRCLLHSALLSFGDCRAFGTSSGSKDKTTAMQTNQPQYFDAYRSVKMTRGTQGVLVVEFHTGGGPLIFTAQDHTEF